MALEVVDLSDNMIVTIPHSILEMSRLVQLDLGRNRLSFLPPEIGFLPKLKNFNLEMNPLTSLPPSLGSDPNFSGHFLFLSFEMFSPFLTASPILIRLSFSL